MDTLADLWRRHQHAPFPAACLAAAVDGTTLLALDASAGACLTASLRSDGVPRPLPPARRAALERDAGLARRFLAAAGGDPEGRAYFERVVALADAVLAVRE